MLQPPNNTSAVSSPFPSSPAGSNFIPRKEFVQNPPRTSSFALLAFTSNNAIRLSNFPESLVTSLRSLLESVIGLRSFRENAEHKLCEIVLAGKPWSNPKSLSTEVVLVQVFSVLLSHGYTFLSHLDYGREHNDRLSLAFSRPIPSPSPDPLSSAQPMQPLLVPFALSFPSPTALRVVCSPLHATPAILQSVRGAWPRGVSSEKKLGEGCYEFKLKGYSWFQEDTFPEDALSHILTLLTALDKHSWTLITSLSLTTTRTRAKDLWIFSGPDSGAAPPIDAINRPASPVHLGSPLSRSVQDPIVDHTQEGSGDSLGEGDINAHDRGSSNSPASLGHSGSKRLSKIPKDKEGHMRTASDATSASAVLRKRAPLKRTSDEPMPGEEQPLQPRMTDHDIIPDLPPSAPGVIYSTPKTAPGQNPHTQHAQTDTIHVSALPAMRFPTQGPSQGNTSPQAQTPMGPPPSHPLVSLPEPAAYHHADEDEDIHSSVFDGTEHARTMQSPEADFQHASHIDVSTPPLLPPTAFRPRSHSPDEFRDSAFSDATGHSFDVPIQWIPAREHEHGPDEDVKEGMEGARAPRPPPSAFPDSLTNRSSISTGPLPPGGWASTPSTEIDDPVAGAGAGAGEATLKRNSKMMESMPVRQNTITPRSPQIVRPDLPGESSSADTETEEGVIMRGDGIRRKSEAGVLGVIPSPAREDVPPVPQGHGHANGHSDDVGAIEVNTKSAEKEGGEGGEKPKEGWVLVSVASESDSLSPPLATAAAAAAQAAGPSPSPTPAPGTTHVPLSAAQIIAAADAASPEPLPAPAPEEATTSSSPATGTKDDASSPAPASRSEKSTSTLGRLFSRRKAVEGGIQKVKAADQEVDGGKEKGSRFKKRTGGGVLPTIRSGRRISID